MKSITCVSAPFHLDPLQNVMVSSPDSCYTLSPSVMKIRPVVFPVIPLTSQTNSTKNITSSKRVLKQIVKRHTVTGRIIVAFVCSDVTFFVLFFAVHSVASLLGTFG